MAELERIFPENVAGDFFVDSTCIDCDACRQIAPDTFRDAGDHSFVYHQPEADADVLRAQMALVACPTASIGTRQKRNASRAVAAFPALLDENVYFCGFTSESSFGAWSYLIVRPDDQGGNVLVDSPRFNKPLARRIAEIGGVRTMFLTHRDDVADHAKFASEFGCERVMHAADGAERLGTETVIAGRDEARLDNDLLVIPTPGHTRGHMVLLYQDKFLFSGDHMWWSPERNSLSASRSVNWYSWPEQVKSLERLLDYRFEWVLPGHGRMRHDSPEALHESLQRLVDSHL